ncbi:MAG: RNA methyltransferase, partial [Longimicrobiales bacterium]|nr:RNA methyltransferase [Longimicrobiales bacterium]
VVALDGTADPWGTRAVRASSGLVFRTPIHCVRGRAIGEVIDALPRPLLAAEMAGDDPSGHSGAQWSLVVGNEGGGVREEVLRRCEAKVGVPMPGGTESLNVAVAGAILLYALSPLHPDRTSG